MSEQFPEKIFIERKDLEILSKHQGMTLEISAEYSPQTQVITHTEKYYHQAKISQLEERLRIIGEAAEELVEEIHSQHELGGPSFDGTEPLEKALAAIKEKK